MAKPFKADIQKTIIISGELISDCIELFTDLFKPYSNISELIDVEKEYFPPIIEYTIRLIKKLRIKLTYYVEKKGWNIDICYENHINIIYNKFIIINNDFAEIISKIYDIINEHIQSAESVGEKQHYESLLKEMNLI